MWYVYVLKSVNHPFIYIGFTRNVEQRLEVHSGGLNQSTRHCAPYILEAYIAVRTEAKAIELERYFKKGSGKSVLKKRIMTSQI